MSPRGRLRLAVLARARPPVAGVRGWRSRENHPDQPEWLSHVNASVLKVKLATAIIGISSIHLLRTFINAQAYDTKTLFYQTTIHVAFLFSALAIAAVDRILPTPSHVRDMNGNDRH